MVYGKGLVKGLGITLKEFFKPKVTEQYPEQRPRLAPRFRGSFKLDPAKCIACGICANNCPNRAITMESIKDENKKRKLTKYEMNLGYCMYCGFCTENCPTKALQNTHDFEHACYTRDATKLKLYEQANVPENQTSETR